MITPVRRLSVRLSLLLSMVVVPSLAMVGLLVTLRETGVVEDLVVKEARTAALSGAAAYAAVLEHAISSKALTADDVFDPRYEPMRFVDELGRPIQVDDARYHTALGDYTDAHGVKAIQDAIMAAGGFLFASGMDVRGYVPSAHSAYDHPPRGNATPELAAWDRAHSRQKRMYDGAEQLSAAGYRGNPKAPVAVLDYPRDTGETAWDVVAPIDVKGRHFGGFRVGVARDRIKAQYRDLIVGLSLMFGLIAALLCAFVFVVTRRSIRPLSQLAKRFNEMSVSSDPRVLAERIHTDDPTEIGDVTIAFNRLRASLHAAMQRVPLVLVVIAVAAGTAHADRASRQEETSIAYRQFSDSAAIGPSMTDFSAKLDQLTGAVDRGVHFVRLPGIPRVPPQFADILSAVVAGAAAGGFDAAYVSGSDLNRTWGFVYNSGVPFGPTFDEFAGWLYAGGGLAVAQSILARRGVVAIPVVGSPEQLSGYFAEPVGGKRGIGLAGLCTRPWVLRYLPPGEDVLSAACDELVAAHRIPRRALTFVQAVPGGGSLVDAVAAGKLNGFEFATPLDDVSQLMRGDRTPASVGLRWVHAPGWHQPFLITWLVVNSHVWDGLSQAQRLIVQSVARDSVLTSYADNLRRQGPALQEILDSGVALVQWSAQDLARLRDVTTRVLDARTGDESLPAADRADYTRILESLRGYMAANALYLEINRGARKGTVIP